MRVCLFLLARRRAGGVRVEPFCLTARMYAAHRLRCDPNESHTEKVRRAFKPARPNASSATVVDDATQRGRAADPSCCFSISPLKKISASTIGVAARSLLV